MYHDSITDSYVTNGGPGHNFIILFLILCNNSIAQIHDNGDDGEEKQNDGNDSGDDDGKLSIT